MGGKYVKGWSKTLDVIALSTGESELGAVAKERLQTRPGNPTANLMILQLGPGAEQQQQTTQKKN